MTAHIVKLASLLLLCGGLAGQELVTLANGATVEGKISRRGKNARVTSQLGWIEVDRDQVEARVPVDDLMAKYRSHVAYRPKDSLDARLAIAKWCFDRGLTSGVVAELDGALQLGGTEDVRALSLIKELSRQWTLHKHEDAADGRERRGYIKFLFRTYAGDGMVQAAITAHRTGELTQEELLRPALRGMKDKHASTRWLCATLLEPFRHEPERINPLYRRALSDPSRVVRKACAESLGATRDKVFVSLFAKNLMNQNQQVRMYAGEALGNLGLEEGTAPLLDALAGALVPPPDGGAGSVRNYAAFVTQRAYVKDFDVEVAQGAVIADPVVDIVQDGVVLDVKVVSVHIERTIYSRALRRLTGVDLGRDIAAWRRHLKLD